MKKPSLKILWMSIVLLSGLAYAESYYGPTAKNDRLYQIALALKPSKEVTAGQTMAAIFELNHGAFEGNNINNLHKGSMLLIPTTEQIKQISKKDAANLVNSHQRDWSKEKPADVVKTDDSSIKRINNLQPDAGNVEVSEDDLQNFINSKIDLPVNKRIRAIGQNYSQIYRVKDSNNYTSLDYTAIPAEINYSNIPRVDFSRVHAYESNPSEAITSTGLNDLKNQLNELQLQLSSVINILHDNTEFFTNRKSIENKFAELGGYSVSTYLGKNFNLNSTNVANPHLEIGIALLISILVLGLIVESMPRRKSSANTYISEEIIENPNDEYDFMGSEEGIPAKMNLARAYFDMGLPEKARKVLTEIAARGDSNQKEEARNMLLDLDK
jgi:FimV-like protein